MHASKLVSSVLVLAVCFAASTAKLDYSPCKYNANEFQEIMCVSQNAFEVLEAFRQNKNNSNIREIQLRNIANLTDDITKEIFDIVASAASDKIKKISLEEIGSISRAPKAFSRFTNLRDIYMTNIKGIKILPAESMTFTSNTLKRINFHFSDLEVIEPGAFRGNFSGTEFGLIYNHLQKFDEAVFESIASDSIIDVRRNLIQCDCDLAWIIRDNRHLLDRVSGDCLEKNGTRIPFIHVDLNSLSKCEKRSVNKKRSKGVGFGNLPSKGSVPVYNLRVHNTLLVLIMFYFAAL